MATKTPNLTKLLLAGLRDAGVKPTTKDSPSGRDFRVLVGGKTVAHVERGKEGALRVYVRAAKLPAKLAKHFAETKSSGYAATFRPEDDLTNLVAAVVVAAGEETS